MNNVIHKLCDDIKELGKDFESTPSGGNPIEAACHQANADLCWRLADTIRFSLTGEER